MKANIKTIIAIFGVMTLVATSLSSVVSAAPCKNDSNFFLPTWYKNLCDSSGTTIASPMGGSASNTQQQGNGTQTNATQKTESSLTTWLVTIALNIVQILLTIVGYVSLGYIIYGGFKYMTQGDNSSGTMAARKTIQNAVIGLVISIMSVAIIVFVEGAIQ